MNLMYSNISGGLVFAGDVYGEMLFSKVSLRHYIDFFREKNIDILCLSEAHLESKNSSHMVDQIADQLGLSYHAVLALSESHLDTSKQQGMAVISRYPIIKQEAFTIPSPGIEVDRPNGDHWRMFDKGALRVWIDVDGKLISIVNFAYFPFHHFNRDVTESQFTNLRQQLLKILIAEDNTPTLVTGDFNCKGHAVIDAFPELFAGDALRQAVKVPTTVIGAHEELDQILYQPSFFDAGDGYATENGSDHLAIGVTIRMK